MKEQYHLLTPTNINCLDINPRKYVQDLYTENNALMKGIKAELNR